MKFNIAEIDKDYRVITDSFYKEFETKTEADKWCKDNSRSGYYYFVIEE